jgi:two-component system, NarL family, sensor histidine kinase DesK
VATHEQEMPADGQRMFNRWQGTLLVGVWLVFLIQPLVQAVPKASGPVAVATVAATVAFAALYLVTITSGFQHSRREAMFDEVAPGRLARGLAAVVLLVLLALATVPALHADSLVFAIYIATASIAVLPLRLAMTVVGAAAVAIVTTYALRPADRSNVSGTLLGLVLAVAAMRLARRVRERSFQLDRVRAQMTDLAIENERERMARDLHDILGHSLTVIVMKAELAKLLADREPDRVAAEVSDIERLARSALADVRATISGSREVTLSRELVHARSALMAAGIQPHLPGSVDDVPEGASALFGWVLREGVTNVVRHSGAANCWVRVTPRSISVIDDGGGHAVGTRTSGQGLTGLTRRLAEVGGSVEVASTPAKGFEVRADLPPDWQPPVASRSHPRPGSAASDELPEALPVDRPNGPAAEGAASESAAPDRPGAGLPAATT